MSRKPPFTRWSDGIPPDTQLVLSHFPYPGEFARVTDHETCSHLPENWRTVKLRPDWKEYPSYKDTDRVPWEWICPEPAFSVSPDQLVFVISEVKVHVYPPPPGYEHIEDWYFYLNLIQRCGDPLGKLGWCRASSLEVPWL